VPRQAVHTRSIVCRSFRRDDGMLDIDGRFIDKLSRCASGAWMRWSTPATHTAAAAR
jgi:hypothetical protein